MNLLYGISNNEQGILNGEGNFNLQNSLLEIRYSLFVAGGER